MLNILCRFLCAYSTYRLFGRYLVYSFVMAKRSSNADKLRKATESGRSMRDISGRVPTRTAPAYSKTRDLGPGFDVPSFDTGSGYMMSQEEQNAVNYPGITNRMFNAQSAFKQSVPFAGRTLESFREQYVPGVKKMTSVEKFLNALSGP